MYNKYTLLVGGLSYDVSKSQLKNWDDIKTDDSRNDFDGVERTFTSKFEFVGGAYSLLKNEYESNYLSASATIVISVRNNSWNYNEKFRCLLDFSKYVDDGYTISIEGVDNTMKNIIKSNGGTEYEIPVSELMETEKLQYDGLEIEQTCEWTIIGDSNENTNEVSFVRPAEFEGFRNEINTAQLYITNPQILHNDILTVRDTLTANPRANTSFCATNNSPATIHLFLEFEFTSTLRASAELASGRTDILSIENSGSGSYSTFSFDQDISLGRYSSLTLSFEPYEADAHATFKVRNFKMKVTWLDRRSNTIDIDLISPTTILNALVNRMINNNAIQSNSSIDISKDSRLGYTYMCAAESIRGIISTNNNPDGAKIYTSFNKFRDWMKCVFGYVYEIDGYNVIFRHRNQYFDKTVVKTISSYNDYNYSLNSKLIYSRVKAGYDQQNYEEVNGRDEYNFGITFSTGVALTDTELNLVSPYRCDNIGFEILTTKRDEDTTDSSSDKDIFFVAVRKVNNDHFELVRSGSIGNVLSSETRFNAMYSPRTCILANKEIIGACTRVLEFASSEGNSDVSINGVGEKDTINISNSERLFTAGTISFNTSEIDLPDNRKGVIALEYRDKTIYGFIDGVEINWGKSKESKYKLIEKV